MKQVLEGQKIVVERVPEKKKIALEQVLEKQKYRKTGKKS